MPFIRVTVATLLVALLCTPGLLLPAPAAAGNHTFVSAGCKTEYFLIERLAAAYQAKTGKQLIPWSVGNRQAMSMLQRGDIAFAFTCKPIERLSAKLKLDPQQAAGWQSLLIAKDPIVVVVHPDTGVSDLSLQQLTALFRGEVKNWRELGGSDLPVLTAHIDPKMESGMLQLFKEFTVGSSGQLDPAAQQIHDPQGLGRFVAATPGAVSFLPLVAYRPTFGTLLAIDGVRPTRQSVLDGSYGLSADYYLTLEQQSPPQVADFVAFVHSELGQSVIARDFIPVPR